MIFRNFLIHLAIIVTLISLGSCNNSNNSINKPLVIGISADYPPFEFIQNGVFKGLDIELARLIAKELQVDIKFKDLNFNNLFLAINSKQIDMAISTITVTEERGKNFDLSIPYHYADLAVVFRSDTRVENITDLAFKKIGVQLGSTMEIWAKDLANISLITMDLNLQLIESLKAKQLEAVIIELAQAKEFCKNQPNLKYIVISKSKNGYVVAMQKGSKLLPQVNSALSKIIQGEQFKKLKHKWLEVEFEMELHDAT